jgi:hypothetical protein
MVYNTQNYWVFGLFPPSGFQLIFLLINWNPVVGQSPKTQYFCVLIELFVPIFMVYKLIYNSVHPKWVIFIDRFFKDAISTTDFTYRRKSCDSGYIQWTRMEVSLSYLKLYWNQCGKGHVNHGKLGTHTWPKLTSYSARLQASHVVVELANFGRFISSQ